jgi:hypothetical protein
MNVLRQKAETHAASAHDVARVGSLFATDEMKDSCLASPVSPYEANVLTLVNLQGRAAQDILRAV